MNEAFEFHDSRLREFERCEDGTGFLLFWGSVYRAQGELFKAGQQSGFQLVRFHFSGMRVEGPLIVDEHCSDGSITIDGETTESIVYLPLDREASVRLTFDLSPLFETTSVQAQAIRVELEGEFEQECIWEEDAAATIAPVHSSSSPGA